MSLRDPQRLHRFTPSTDGTEGCALTGCGQPSADARHVVLSELGALNAIAASLEQIAGVLLKLDAGFALCGHGYLAPLCAACLAQGRP